MLSTFDSVKSNEILRAIDQFSAAVLSGVGSLKPRSGYADGDAGLSLYWRLRANEKECLAALSRVEKVERTGLTHASFYSGSYGVFAALEILAIHGADVSDLQQTLNFKHAFLQRQKSQILRSAGRYELVGGVTGIAIYESLSGDEKSFSDSVQYLEATRIETDYGQLWRDPKNPTAISLDLGLSHGVFGTLLMLAQRALNVPAHPGNPEIELLGDTHQAAVQLLERIPFDAFNYSYPVRRHPGTVPRAWCYGAAGSAFAVFYSSRALKDKKSESLALTLFNRTIDEALKLAPLSMGYSICHGWSGLALMCHRLFEATHLSEFRLKAADLLSRGVEVFQLEPRGHEKLDASLLCGAPGLGAVILTLNGRSDFAWDTFLLTSWPTKVSRTD